MPETYWKAQENRVKHFVEKRGWLKARRNPHSGSLPIETLKGDVCAEYPTNHMAIRVDHKSTRGTESIGLFRKDLRKIEQEGNLQGELGFVTFGFKGTPRLYAALPLTALLKLLESAPMTLVHDLTGLQVAEDEI